MNTVRCCIDRYLSDGVNLVIFDDEQSGSPIEITDDAKSWLQKYLKKMDIKLFKIRFYLERKDLILDNHSAHTSKETKNFLATLPEG